METPDFTGFRVFEALFLELPVRHYWYFIHCHNGQITDQQYFPMNRNGNFKFGETLSLGQNKLFSFSRRKKYANRNTPMYRPDTLVGAVYRIQGTTNIAIPYAPLYSDNTAHIRTWYRNLKSVVRFMPMFYTNDEQDCLDWEDKYEINPSEDYVYTKADKHTLWYNRNLALNKATKSLELDEKFIVWEYDGLQRQLEGLTDWRKPLNNLHHRHFSKDDQASARNNRLHEQCGNNPRHNHDHNHNNHKQRQKHRHKHGNAGFYDDDDDDDYNDNDDEADFYLPPRSNKRAKATATLGEEDDYADTMKPRCCSSCLKRAPPFMQSSKYVDVGQNYDDDDDDEYDDDAYEEDAYEEDDGYTNNNNVCDVDGDDDDVDGEDVVDEYIGKSRQTYYDTDQIEKPHPNIPPRFRKGHSLSVENQLPGSKHTSHKQQMASADNGRSHKQFLASLSSHMPDFRQYKQDTENGDLLDEDDYPGRSNLFQKHSQKLKNSFRSQEKERGKLRDIDEGSKILRSSLNRYDLDLDQDLDDCSCQEDDDFYDPVKPAGKSSHKKLGGNFNLKQPGKSIDPSIGNHHKHSPKRQRVQPENEPEESYTGKTGHKLKNNLFSSKPNPNRNQKPKDKPKPLRDPHVPEVPGYNPYYDGEDEDDHANSEYDEEDIDNDISQSPLDSEEYYDYADDGFDDDEDENLGGKKSDSESKSLFGSILKDSNPIVNGGFRGRNKDKSKDNAGASKNKKWQKWLDEKAPIWVKKNPSNAGSDVEDAGWQNNVVEYF